MSSSPILDIQRLELRLEEAEAMMRIVCEFPSCRHILRMTHHQSKIVSSLQAMNGLYARVVNTVDEDGGVA